jgi:hypothetical protein
MILFSAFDNLIAFASLMKLKFDIYQMRRNKDRYTLQIDTDSLKNIAENQEQAVIYGFSHCKYIAVIFTLKINQVFKSIFFHLDFKTSLEGTKFKQIQTRSQILQMLSHGIDKGRRLFIAQKCKNTLTALVFENFRREKAGLPLIPMIYCVDIDDNPHPFTIDVITSTKKTLNSLVTHKELRRVQKLCNEFENEAIQRVAKKTFKFVKLEKSDQGYKFKELTPFWENKDWDQSWNDRKVNKQKSSSEKKQAILKTDWREQLNTLIKSSP